MGMGKKRGESLKGRKSVGEGERKAGREMITRKKVVWGQGCGVDRVRKK